jgi:UDP-galactopyranose mutase
MRRSAEFDLVVVGAGFAGSVVAERAASRLRWRVLVVESRDHVGGNAADYVDSYGVRVHRYGPHIFHTNSEAVWNYASRFTEWIDYTHKVFASLDTGFIPLPFNLIGVDLCFPAGCARSIRAALSAEFGAGAEVPILSLRKSSDRSIAHLATFLYDKLYLGYNLKQWGRRPEELDPSVTARVPVRIGEGNNYFRDRFQGVPRRGYTSLFEQMLSHPNIELLLGTDYHTERLRLSANHVVYTGPIDRYFDYRFGALPYRTLRFELSHRNEQLAQPAAVVTYPNGELYTRSTEFKHFSGDSSQGTTIAREFSGAHRPGETIPFYPMPLPEARALYQRYYEAAQSTRSVTFCGRLGRYQYLNMDQAIGQALSVVERFAAVK